MSLLFFIIPPDSTLLMQQQDRWHVVHGAASMGLPVQPDQPIRLQVVETDDVHPLMVARMTRDTWSNLKLVFADGTERFFKARHVGATQNGNITTSSLDALAIADPGVVDDFRPLAPDRCNAFARDLPEIGL